MRLRTLLATTVSSALALGIASVPALAVPVPDPAGAGTVIAWGDPENPNGGPALAVPSDLTQPVLSIAASNRATGAVTLDGHVRVWGAAGAAEAEEVPSGITGAVAISISSNNGAVLHQDGRITGWGAPVGIDPAPVSQVPTDLRAKAVAVQGGLGTGFAVRTDGTLAVWGTTPAITPPEGLSGLVDVSASLSHIIALRADGTIATWGNPGPAVDAVPDFGGKKVVRIATGPSRSGVVFEDGTIEIWGSSVPSGEPAFDGTTAAQKVISLGLWSGNAAAVTADGQVHGWGSAAPMATVPSTLEDRPASAVVVGNFHVAAIAITFRDLTKPTVAGEPTVGETLTATPATFSLTPDAPATGQWYAGDAPIEGQTGTTLPLTAAQLGKAISYRSTATRGDDTVISSSVPTGAVTPAVVASTTTLSVSPAKGAVGTARTVTATVGSTGTPTGSVAFTLGATTVSKPLAGGKATWTLPTTLAAGSHRITASYGGDSTTEPSTATPVTISVAKAVAKVSGKAKATGKTKKTAKRVSVTITVKAPRGVSPAGKVTIALKGEKKLTVRVNAKGKATATFKTVKRGKHTATVKYAGNANVAAARTKVKLKV
ncbi:Ig-like domain repeat protein [Nocardioides lianchengensis]|uniref:Ig-like domain (Group 3) n=1 Tax=Nocardioides lianchengensis TaxID=1045774 RepID=A0A1G7B5J6_9ACTN|nr:Ig-like domain repeat protein [Nocardioides lianchengensis]NYG10110.1 hypothetical protein [Nocardioides lianchengensis]SDE22301.1 Ig-like domain (group 3) [Nocardioides lianchengensis]